MRGDRPPLTLLFKSLPLCLKTAPRPECCSDFTEENEHKDYYENDFENPGRAVSPETV